MSPPRTLRRRRQLAILAVTAAALGGGLVAGLEPPASAATVQVQQSASANWAGYVVKQANFSSVSGSWVVPSVASSSQGYSATWVGLGGASSSSQSLEQVGTGSDTVNGRTSYYAWYELVPAASVKLNLSIHAGDHVSGRVTVKGTTITTTLSDVTTGKSATKTLHMSNPDTTSAEWIVEAPSASAGGGGYSQLPLAQFGKVTFTNASATGNGHAGSIADSQWTAEKVALMPSAGGRFGGGAGFPGSTPGTSTGSSSAQATPSSLSGNGTSFAVSRQSDSAAASGPAVGRFPGYGHGYGSGYGYGPGPRPMPF
jgi:hypothetical protein